MSRSHGAPLSAWSLKFLSVEAWSGIVLLVAATMALAVANSPWGHAYEELWEHPLVLAPAALVHGQTLHFWVNDGLMTVFFLLVGLEVRRELNDGSLSDPRVATLPIIAALGGVLVPALLYWALNPGEPTREGWAVPTATDIAFAVGVLAIIGRGMPPALRMLLLTLAIIDDIAAILIIALVYSSGIAWGGLLVVALGVACALALQFLGVRPAWVYVAPGAVVWYGMLSTGVHPTLAGVILGLLTPVRPDFGLRRRTANPERTGLAPVIEVEAGLHPWVAFGIMPLFALANAGVHIGGVHPGSATFAVVAGIVTGLVLGKPLGIVLAARAAVALKICELPADVTWRDVRVLGALAGIGFTMSIFIANLAFTDAALLTAAKAGVLAASFLAGALSVVLALRRRPPAVPA